MDRRRLEVLSDNTSALAGAFDTLALIEAGEITSPPEQWTSMDEWREHLILLMGSYVNIIHSNWKSIPELGNFL